MDIADITTKLRLHHPQIIGTKRANAVLIPLVETEDGVCLLFETRSQNVWQPGEVCFPGGGIEDGGTASEAAIRECCEELGINKNQIELIAQFDTAYGMGSFSIESFVAKVDVSDLSKLNYDKNEVAEVFMVPLQWFNENESLEFSFPMHLDIPSDFDYSVFGLDGPYNWRKSVNDVNVWKYQDHYIWGLTARLVKALIQYLNNN